MEDKTTNTATNQISGELTFSDKVIQKIIGFALSDIDGLLTIDGGFFSNITEKLVNTNDVTTGIHTEVGKKQVAVDMDIVVEFGKDIRTIYDKVKETISSEVSEMTHLEVIEINVNVVDIKSQEQYQEESETVQDKVSGAASSTGQYLSKQTNKATKKAKNEVKERTEPRVE
ncbi:Asp23/Gls24 family envelope stress response protein [Tetragenococcus koreensis]|uniref:Stress response regulator gls24 homolog n=1 Tax=Tetragenococcus koreensis TaxID=290335 RepID=A0AAN4RLH4_9ENTE|nr:Asp23/Gls24 family envelope stress response protein [Tetragenococcus koreensis]AYW45562.1 Asp23/Gls24 family envelope stress response protein [Tetragenococcus koreensis]MCF1585569.1 Asp23/Gls24 family envelope stress response protein [Tetragenococcus koreensis]MCF1615115.1 Asp23/Gls24 family envelope stress response protein [Tetragenococcus koreensis]MCF1617751.1 Asp23/Gls24 family envelope stress response protein [Tetragenococcus koreensis]MCF1620705.1 Asp23/Gls24 family envelope stress re